MKIERSFAAAIAFLAFSIIFLLSMPAFGHDPLKDSQVQNGHHHKHRRQVPETAGLANIRSKIIAFRESGDDRHLDEAWALLAPALSKPNPDPETLIVASFVSQSRHRFDDAIVLIRKSLTINARNDEAWLLLASIHLVLGDTQAAAAACHQLRDAHALVLLTCSARLALATGDHERALQRLHRVLQALNNTGLPAETLAWSYSVAGDLAVAAAQPEKAVLLYQRSLALAERTQVRSALVDVFLQAGGLREAANVLDHGSQALPLLIRRLIVARRLGRLDEVQPVLTKVRREFDQWIANEDWLHAREMTRFFIDVTDEHERARQLALINIELQKEPEDRRLEERTRPAA